MNKLLVAGFSRLKLSKAFLIGTLLSALFAVFEVVFRYLDMKSNGGEDVLDNGLFSYTIIISIISSVVFSLLLGTEYSDGTIRNKLVVGHTRSAVYFSSLIVCFVAVTVMQVAFLVVALSLGLPLLGLEMSAGSVLILVLCALVLSFAFVSLFTMTAMLCRNKAVTAIICILGTFFLFFVGVFINSSLNEPEMYESYSYTDNTGIHLEEEEPNPHYLSGTKRKVYEFLYDCLPGCQTVQISSLEADNPGVLMLYSFGVIVITTAAGMCAFKRKDIN